MREIGIASCPEGCAGQSENKRDRTPTAELDFGSEANHAVSNYQTVFAAVPTVKQNQPPLSMLSASNDRLNEMDFKVLIADTAIADLKQIVEFVAEDNPERFSASTFLINCAGACLPFYAVL